MRIFIQVDHYIELLSALYLHTFGILPGTLSTHVFTLCLLFGDTKLELVICFFLSSVAPLLIDNDYQHLALEGFSTAANKQSLGYQQDI